MALVDYLRRAADGDHSALAALRASTFPKLKAVAMGVLNDRTACDDVLQEAYLRVWRRCGDYDPALSGPMTWMRTIVRNSAIDHLRVTRVFRLAMPIDHAIECPQRSQLEILETKDLLELVFDRLDQERPIAVAALRLSLIEGHAYREIAERFDVPPGTMKGMIRRLLTNLRRSLDICEADGGLERRNQHLLPSLIGDSTGRSEVYRLMGQFSRTSPATILVVESEAIVRLELAEWLQGEGLAALTAGNADEAIALLEAHAQIEIMMTDINMTGSMDGIRLARHVRDRWPPVKIIVVSGRARSNCVELPENVLFVPKPINRDGLLVDLGSLLAQVTNGGSAFVGGDVDA